MGRLGGLPSRCCAVEFGFKPVGPRRYCETRAVAKFTDPDGHEPPIATGENWATRTSSTWRIAVNPASFTNGLNIGAVSGIPTRCSTTNLPCLSGIGNPSGLKLYPGPHAVASPPHHRPT